ncbi:cytochrome P450 [Tsukamurella sp. 8F]|uniref:cytochrome P450 n=1 Tax=unclassified Tsukamurella TaxID=2633480 RepID=UPI0023B985D6|nr:MULTISPECIES: cytochrome P450 [unclassified Tsukamurella]MDF0529493.1 cytochrome P450 [Tsukamurella sp. 8J]MDF0585819.1 cytochrome P450 [Tsukamurella sp. 8F]
MSVGASPTRSSRAVFNPFAADFRADPYPAYHALRQSDPVHRSLGTWVLTRYDDVRRVLRDPTYSSSLIPRLVQRRADRLDEQSRTDAERIVQLGRKSLVFTDNPDHARLRALVNRLFDRRSIDRLRPTIGLTAQRALDALTPRIGAGVDLISTIAGPVPVAVLCDWMQLPTEVTQHVSDWTHDIRYLLEPGLMRESDYARVGSVVGEFTDALAEVITRRTTRPGDDLISELIAARVGGTDRLSDAELAHICVMCFVAGTETTTALIGNAVVALLSNPGPAAAVRERPELVESVVRETLRYDSPLQMTKREATVEDVVGGKTIRPGDQVLLCLAAANRDPSAFDEPDAFRLDRPEEKHVAFGYGLHGCLGAALAETTACVTLDRILRTLVVESAGEPEWQDDGFIVRGPRRLSVVGTRR